MNKDNYRVYDRTGGGVVQDFFASSDEEAVEYGRAWIEGNDWEPGEIAQPLDAEVCPLREIILDEQGGYTALDGTRYTPDDDDDLVDAEGYVLTGDRGQYLQVGDDEEGERMDCSGVTPFIKPEDCVADQHDWQSPFEVVGGCEKNPGVWGSEHGGLLIRMVCSHCGIYREKDTGATNNCGKRATSISYESADEKSRQWIGENEEEE